VKRQTDERVDVCIVFHPLETVLAEAVAQRLSDAGLTADLAVAKAMPGEDLAETVRHAVDGSRAMAFLMSPAGTDDQVLHVFAGAAWAVELPIFVLRNNIRPSEYSSFFRQFPAYLLWSGFRRLVKDLDRVADRTPA
jgi:hypothetical protein